MAIKKVKASQKTKNTEEVNSNKYKKIVKNPLAIHGAIIRDEYFEMPKGNSKEFINSMIKNKLIEKA